MSTQAAETPSARAKPAPLDRGALNLPNAITVSRLALAAVLFVMIDRGANWLLTVVVFVVAAGTDFLDGWIARRYNMVTTLGRILDPFADKIIICGTFFFLLGREAETGVNAWMVTIIVGREMFVTSLRGFLEQHGLDFSASMVGKVKMGLQCVAVVVALSAVSATIQEQIPQTKNIRDIVLWSATAFTFYSGVVYVSRAAKMLRDAAE